MRRPLAVATIALGAVAVLLVSVFLFYYVVPGALQPEEEWSRTYGPYEGYAIIQTADGGYAVAGVNATKSDRGFGDYLPTLIKTNQIGDLEWKKHTRQTPT